MLALFTLAGRPELYPLLWLLPWMTSWRVINRLRSIAEHGGMERSPDRRRTTHHVRQSRLASFWLVPFNTGWHLAHHVDMGVPWRNLPALHHELVDAGWVTPDARVPVVPGAVAGARVPASRTAGDRFRWSGKGCDRWQSGGGARGGATLRGRRRPVRAPSTARRCAIWHSRGQ